MDWEPEWDSSGGVANWGSAVLVATGTGTGTGTEWTGQPVPVRERVFDSLNLIGYIKSLVREYYPLRHHTADRPSSGNPPFLTPFFFFFLSQSHMISFLFGHNSKKMSPQSLAVPIIPNKTVVFPGRNTVSSVIYRTRGWPRAALGRLLELCLRMVS